ESGHAKAQRCQAEYVRLAALHVRWPLKSSSIYLSIKMREGSTRLSFSQPMLLYPRCQSQRDRSIGNGRANWREQKSPGRSGALSSAQGIQSVTRRDRGTPAAEAVVQANQTHIHVLADVLVLEEDASSVEIDVARAHEQVVVLDTDRPVRSKAILKA